LPDISENNNDGVLSTPALSGIFSAFAQLRQPRTAALVKGARLQGESRVEDGGPEACLARDERIREAWTNKEAVEARYRALFVEPF
jgi:salicylate hydroxylase